MNAISNLWNGRSGLAKTYWLWGVSAGIPWGIALALITPGSNPAIFAVLAFVVYYVIVHVGIWRAASQYQGAKLWANLAKVTVAITPICLVIGTLAGIIIPAMNQPSRKAPLAKQTIESFGLNSKPIQSYSPSEKPGEVDFFLLMAPPHASAISNYEKILRIHPDALQISSSDNFRQWALNNPKTWSAIKNHDADGLISVFSDFKSKN